METNFPDKYECIKSKGMYLRVLIAAVRTSSELIMCEEVRMAE